MTQIPALPDFYSLRHYAEIDSTNDEARRQAETGAPAGRVIWADRQTAGHGRQGRAWQSPAGNLYCTILLRPSRPAAEVAQLSFAAALAVCDAVRTEPPPRCKWPNDVLIDDRKIAGILLESASAGSGVVWLAVGIGINIASYPAETETPATSLVALGVSTTPAVLLGDLARHFLRWYETWDVSGFGPLRQAWLDRAYRLGGDIRVRHANTEERGRFVDLDASGALVLENGAGRRHISAGAVFPATG